MKNISKKRRWIFGILTGFIALVSIYGSLGIIFPFIAYNMGFKTYDQNKEDSIKDEEKGLLPNDFWNTSTKTINTNVLAGADSQHEVPGHAETPKFDLLYRTRAAGSIAAQLNPWTSGTSNSPIQGAKFAIVLHGISNTRAATYSYAWQYTLRNFYVINYDQHGWGDSRSFGNPTYGYQESTDVSNIVNYIETTFHPSEFVVHGISMGAATTALFAGRYLNQIELDNPTTKFFTIQDAGYTDLYSEFYWYCEHKMKIPGWLVVPQSMPWFNVFSHNNYKAVNPLASFNNFSSPVLIFHGSIDDTVSYQFGLDFFKKKVEAHQAAMFVNMQNVNHVSGNIQLGHDATYTPENVQGSTYFKYVDEFLKNYGGSTQNTNDTEYDVVNTPDQVKSVTDADGQYKTSTWGLNLVLPRTITSDSDVHDLSKTN